MSGQKGRKILILGNVARILYLTRFEFVTSLLEQGHKVFVSMPRERGFDEFQKAGCHVIATPIDRRGINPLKDFSLLLRYRRMIKRIRPDVIFTFTVKPNLYGGWLASKFHIPYYPTITGLGTAIQNYGVLQKLVLALYRRSFRKAPRVFFQNPMNSELMTLLGVVRRDQIVLVPGSGVNLEKHRLEPYPEEGGELRILFIGRLMREKGLLELIEAAKRIRQTYPFVTFEILGDFEEDYRSIIEETSREGTIHYSGYAEDIHPFLTNAHAILLPSWHEGMANVLLEGAATGRPVLASNIAGCRETFDEGISGFGFKPRDVDDLCRTLERFIQTPHSERAAMGIAGRRKMEREFDRERVKERYLEAFDDSFSR